MNAPLSPKYALAKLRTPGPAQAQYVFPFEAFLEAISCPVCNCTKNGSISEPNLRQECCEENDCLCHTDICDDCGRADGSHNLDIEH